MDESLSITLLVVGLIFLFALRWLLSWWVRTTDILKEMRTLNQQMDRHIALQEAILAVLQRIDRLTVE